MGSINIVGLGAGFGIAAWTPALASVKGGGVWSSSPFIPGGQLVARVKEDIIDTITLTCSGANEGEINQRIAEFLYSIEGACAFWTGQIALPSPYVYLEIKLACGDSQYAIVKDYNFTVDSDITTRGRGTSVAVSCTLVVRHGAWQETPPGQYVNQPFGNDEYTGHVNAGAAWVKQRTGNLPADNDFKPVGNFWTGAEWTDYYTWDNSAGGIVGVNLLDTALPYDIWVPPSQVTDYLYFGITREGWNLTVLVPNALPVPNSLVFTLDKALSTANNTLNFVLEYLNNVGVWTNLPFDLYSIYDSFPSPSNDSRQTFLIHWVRQAAMLIQVSGIAGIPVRNGYWFRLRPTVAGYRVRTLRHPYAVQRNFIRFDAEDVPGDLSCPLRLKLFSTTDYIVKRVLMSLYSQPRVNLDGNTNDIDYFTPWMPFLGSNNFQFGGGFYNSVWTGTQIGFASNSGPLNFHYLSDQNLNPGGGWTGAPSLNQLAATVSYIRPAFGGRFRIFAIIMQTGGVIGEIGWRVANFARYNDTTPTFTSRTLTHKILSQWEILDFGEIQLPGHYSTIENIEEQEAYSWGAPATSSVDAFKLYLDFYGSAGNIGTSILGFYLMPIDENFVEVFWPGVGPGASADGNVIRAPLRDSITIDSVAYQKPVVRATVENDFIADQTRYPDGVWQSKYNLNSVAIDKLQIPAGRTSRLYFLSMRYDAASGAFIYDDDPILFLKAYRSAQYAYART